jgi:hypothetical protein
MMNKRKHVLCTVLTSALLANCSPISPSIDKSLFTRKMDVDHTSLIHSAPKDAPEAKLQFDEPSLLKTYLAINEELKKEILNELIVIELAESHVDDFKDHSKVKIPLSGLKNVALQVILKIEANGLSADELARIEGFEVKLRPSRNMEDGWEISIPDDVRADAAHIIRRSLQKITLLLQKTDGRIQVVREELFQKDEKETAIDSEEIFYDEELSDRFYNDLETLQKRLLLKAKDSAYDEDLEDPEYE